MFLPEFQERKAYGVGIDLSLTSTGVSMCSLSKELPDYHYEILSTEGRDLHRQFEIYDMIVADIENLEYPMVCMCIEGYGPINRTSGKITQRAEIAGMLKRRFIIDYKLPVFIVDPKSLKKWATGKGNASKDEMVRQAMLRYGIITDSHNEADALHLGHLGPMLLTGKVRGVTFERY